VILVIAEQRDGKLNRATWETIAAAQQLASGGMPIKVVVLGSAGAVPQELAGGGVAEVLTADHPALAMYTPDAFTMALHGIIESAAPQMVLLPHTYQTRDFAPRLAARLRRPLLTDVTGFSGNASGATFTRPMFQGKLAAQVKPVGEAPWIVTFQIGAFRADAVQKGGTAPVTSVAVTIDESRIRQQPEAPFQEAKQAVDLSQAERIVAVGRGIKSQENIQVAETLAKALGAELAASRPICDNGWLPMERQIGSSGQTVAPKLYVALGISGAIQHLVGMKGARTIVAINKDADAPIFEVADYGIVGDLFEIAPALAAELEKG
jgi:electron transfer flavoprotein alpha subunit